MDNALMNNIAANNISVSIKRISKKYGKKQIFKDFYLDLPKGRVIGLLGENGIGKTTLLKMIANLSMPNEGMILINDQKINESIPTSRHTRDFISFLIEPEHFESFTKVGDVIQEYRNFYPDFDLEKAQNMCSSFGLKSQDKIKNLSKGQKARVCLMLCMSRKTSLYLLDEPMSGFDPKFKKDMVASILSHIEEGQTLIISSHLLRDLENLFDEVVILTPNKATVANADEIRAQGRSIEDFYLEVVSDEYE